MAKTYKDKVKREPGLFGRQLFKGAQAEDRKGQRRASFERKEILRRAALEDLLAGN